jgi:hypothetical protein
LAFSPGLAKWRHVVPPPSQESGATTARLILTAQPGSNDGREIAYAAEGNGRVGSNHTSSPVLGAGQGVIWREVK